MKRLVFALILVLIPLALSLAMGEMLVRILAPQNLSGTWLTEGPRGLMVNRPGSLASHQFGPTRVKYRINAAHQRGGDIVPSELPILALGDSFTFGWLLEEPDSFVGRLQAKLDAQFGQGKARVMNASAGGWGTADQLAYLELFGDSLKPRTVVVFVSVEDFERSVRSRLYRLEGTQLIAGENPTGRSILRRLTQSLPFYGWLLEHSHLTQMLRGLMVSEAGRTDGANAPAPRATTDHQPLAKALFTRMKQWTDARGIALVVMTNGWPDIPYPWLGGILGELGITFVDLVPAIGPTISQDRARYSFVGDGHPSAAAAELIAQAAWPTFQSLGQDYFRNQ